MIQRARISSDVHYATPYNMTATYWYVSIPWCNFKVMKMLHCIYLTSYDKFASLHCLETTSSSCKLFLFELIVNMPDRCAACQSGHAGSSYVGSYHVIPNADDKKGLRERWVSAAPFEWNPGKSAKLCTLHFSIEDYTYDRKDTNTSRKRKLGEIKRKYLKEDAVPRLWPEWPKHYSKKVRAKRTDIATAEARTEKVKIEKQRASDAARLADEVTSLADLKAKRSDQCIRCGWYALYFSPFQANCKNKI